MSPTRRGLILFTKRNPCNTQAVTPTRSIAPLRTTATLVLAAGLCAAPLAAQETPAQGGQLHVVRPGETLWEIARDCLGDPFLWPELFRLNAGDVRDPARIYPSQRLRLPECVQGLPEPGVPAAEPAGESVRIIPAAGTGDVPVVAPGDFFRAAVLVRDAEVPAVGELVEAISPTVVPVDVSPQITLYDRVYVTLRAQGSLRVGDPLHFFRRGREVRPHGRVYRSTGIGTVQALEGNVATVSIRTVYDEIRVGDMAVPVARFPVRAGVTPRRPRQALEGKIIGFQDPHPLQATQEIAFLDVGRSAGVKEGDVFAAYVPRTERHWGTRPEIRVGRMQVVRVTDGTASARITALEHPALEPGMPVRLVAEMP